MNCTPCLSRRFVLSLAAIWLFASAAWPQSTPATGRPSPASTKQLFGRDSLVAWCIVPFDARKRTPEQRAEMLEKLKIHRFAYDWRAEHLPTFEQELGELEKHHIELTAVWFPDALNSDAKVLLRQ